MESHTENIEDLMKIRKEELLFQLNEAYHKIEEVETLEDAHSKPEKKGKGKEGEVVFEYVNESNAVYLKENETHLLPWLLREVFYAFGYRDEALDRKVEENSMHEFAHLGAALQHEGINKWRFGVSLQKVKELNGFVINPFVQFEGIVGIESAKQIILAPEINAKNPYENAGDRSLIDGMDSLNSG